jgi:hypothetical protein
MHIKVKLIGSRISKSPGFACSNHNTSSKDTETTKSCPWHYLNIIIEDEMGSLVLLEKGKCIVVCKVFKL